MKQKKENLSTQCPNYVLNTERHDLSEIILKIISPVPVLKLTALTIPVHISHKGIIQCCMDPM